MAKLFTTLSNPFRGHPESVGETYLEHMLVALRFCAGLSGAAVAAGIHAVFPFLFARTASTIISGLHASSRTRVAASAQDASTSQFRDALD